MIKFFRNIRQSLLNEGKTTKYLKYALGEIVLVVIGILIALQINNWNEGRKQQQAETEFLKGIKNDLTQDKQFITHVLNTMEPKIQVFNTLNKGTLDISKDKAAIDSMLNIYINLGQRTFYPISGSYQAAVSGNQINNYKNKALIRPIIKLYNSTYERLVDNGKILDSRWSDISKIYIHQRRANKFTAPDTLYLSKTLDNLYFHFIQLEYYKNVLVNASDEIDGVLKKFPIDVKEKK